VEATSQMIVPTGILWQDNNDFSVLLGTEFTPFSQKEKYNHLLPNLDFDIELRPGLKGRVSYSKTIAPAQYAQLRSAVSVNATQGSSLNGFLPSAAGANPALVPLESDNVDLSLEWYIGESSYLSAGAFEKRVSNFIGNEVSQENLFDIRDQTAGPRAQAAVNELEAGGFSTDDTNLFVMMAMMENPGSFTGSDGVTWTGGAANFDGTEAQHLAFASRYDLSPNGDDPLFTFNVSRPVNNREAKIHGWEIAGQHFFGSSGFGLQANYTVVRGDVGFDDAGDPNVNQFALLGLSDSANLMLMYEKFGLAVRLAYNWRDEFLQSANVGNFRSPQYVEEYQQVDLSIGYELNKHLSLAFEGLNLTKEDIRWHGRSTKQVWYVEDQGARYSLGARYKF
jgi:TonB-dependent receptor